MHAVRLLLSRATAIAEVVFFESDTQSGALCVLSVATTPAHGEQCEIQNSTQLVAGSLVPFYGSDIRLTTADRETKRPLMVPPGLQVRAVLTKQDADEAATPHSAWRVNSVAVLTDQPHSPILRVTTLDPESHAQWRAKMLALDGILSKEPTLFFGDRERAILGWMRPAADGSAPGATARQQEPKAVDDVDAIPMEF